MPDWGWWFLIGALFWVGVLMRVYSWYTEKRIKPANLFSNEDDKDQGDKEMVKVWIPASPSRYIGLYRPDGSFIRQTGEYGWVQIGLGGYKVNLEGREYPAFRGALEEERFTDLWNYGLIIPEIYDRVQRRLLEDGVCLYTGFSWQFFLLGEELKVRRVSNEGPEFVQIPKGSVIEVLVKPTGEYCMEGVAEILRGRRLDVEELVSLSPPEEKKLIPVCLYQLNLDGEVLVWQVATKFAYLYWKEKIIVAAPVGMALQDFLAKERKLTVLEEFSVQRHKFLGWLDKRDFEFLDLSSLQRVSLN